MTVPTAPPAAVRSAGSQTSTASRTPSPTGTYTDWRRRDVSIIVEVRRAIAIERPSAQVDECAGGCGADEERGGGPQQVSLGIAAAKQHAGDRASRQARGRGDGHLREPAR